MRLLDCFSGAGIGADGYLSVGYEVTGIDIVNQPRYPGAFIQDDALELLNTDFPEQFDVLHLSPPCQAHTQAQHMRVAQGKKARFGDLLTPTLELLRARWNHKPWVVENVPGSPGMQGAITLCGSSFGLAVQRHRLFLSNRLLFGLPCQHSTFPKDPITGRPRPWGIYHTPNDDIADAYRAGKSVQPGGRTARDAAHGCELMGVNRKVTWNELKEGLPPAFTAWVGGQLKPIPLPQAEGFPCPECGVMLDATEEDPCEPGIYECECGWEGKAQ